MAPGNQADPKTDDSDNEDGIDCSNKAHCKEKEEASLFYGTHETQITEGGEADLHKHLVGCSKKNPGHTRFVPVDDFNTNHLPDGHNDIMIVEMIKAIAALTVRVDIRMTSTERPEFWPNTNQPYAFYNIRGSDVMRLGTGLVHYIDKYSEEDFVRACQCHKCQHSDTPSCVWGEVFMSTATHVVFDDLEARHTRCRLFYDRPDSPLVTLGYWTVVEANIEDDLCLLKCVTCDVDLMDELGKMARQWFYLWFDVHGKYKRSRDEDKLIFIVSHPHGCPKQVSVGHWINRCLLRGFESRYTYTTCTCPGSSGAHVHSLGYDGDRVDLRHVHSGVNSEGTNFSSTGRDCRQ